MKKTLFLITVLFGLISFANAEESKWFKAQSKECHVESISATSELVEAQFEGRYLYSPCNILDQNMNTTWCEAEIKGPGIGQKIIIEFTEPVSFDEIQIVNGFNYKGLYYQNNRVKEIQLTQVAKQHFQQKDYLLKDGVEGWQSINFDLLQTAQTVTIQIKDVYKGTKFDDTCFSDIRFLIKGKVIPFTGIEEIRKVQEENSKMLLEKDAGNFEKDFLKYFKTSPYGEQDFKYLILMHDDKEHGILMEYSTKHNSIANIDYNAFFSKTLYKSVNAKYEIDTSYDGGYDDTYFYLKDYKIFKYTRVGYVETETSKIVKLDGNTIYINGIRYTVINPDDCLIYCGK